MCIAEQSGQCKVDGPSHNHSWSHIEFKQLPRATTTTWMTQLIGFRDDRQMFYVSEETDRQEDGDRLRNELQKRLDLELKCCACSPLVRSS